MDDAFVQVQCNVFEGASGEVGLTAAGGLRQLPGLTETYENAALVWFCHSKLVTSPFCNPIASQITVCSWKVICGERYIAR